VATVAELIFEERVRTALLLFIQRPVRCRDQIQDVFGFILTGVAFFNPATAAFRCARRNGRLSLVWRQLLFPAGDNYFSRSTTTTVLT
jgi:hypothetical protein